MQETQNCKINVELWDMNSEMWDINAELSAINAELWDVNSQLQQTQKWKKKHKIARN